jgi:hypothetical protein
MFEFLSPGYEFTVATSINEDAIKLPVVYWGKLCDQDPRKQASLDLSQNVTCFYPHPVTLTRRGGAEMRSFRLKARTSLSASDFQSISWWLQDANIMVITSGMLVFKALDFDWAGSIR